MAGVTSIVCWVNCCPLPPGEAWLRALPRAPLGCGGAEPWGAQRGAGLGPSAPGPLGFQQSLSEGRRCPREGPRGVLAWVQPRHTGWHCPCGGMRGTEEGDLPRGRWPGGPKWLPGGHAVIRRACRGCCLHGAWAPGPQAEGRVAVGRWRGDGWALWSPVPQKRGQECHLGGRVWPLGTQRRCREA